MLPTSDAEDTCSSCKWDQIASLNDLNRVCIWDDWQMLIIFLVFFVNRVARLGWYPASVPSPFVPPRVPAMAAIPCLSLISCFLSWCLVTSLPHLTFPRYQGGTGWVIFKNKQRAGSEFWGERRCWLSSASCSFVFWGLCGELPHVWGMSFSLSGGTNSLFPTRLLILISVFNNSRLLSLHQIQWMFDFLKTGTS